MSDEANLYDAFPYFSQPILCAHIDRLAACGRLFGVDVRPLRAARVRGAVRPPKPPLGPTLVTGSGHSGRLSWDGVESEPTPAR